ncbi:MAG: GHKL domain-containing protein [Lachnospiraceae bacterium]|nr:GHKL domain-containing protein [Lachnospiraceae bacterium]
MFDLDVYILNGVIAVSNIWIVNRYWESFFEKKKISFISVIIWIFFGGIQYISQYVSGNINIGLTCTNAVLILMIAICGYKCAGRAKYFLLVLFCAVWALVELFAFFLFSSVQMENEKLITMGTVVSILFMIIFVYIISVVWDKKNSDIIPIRFYVYLLLVPIGSIYIAVIQFYSQSSELLSTITISVLLLFNIVIFDIYTKMNKLFLYEKERAVYAQQLNIISGSTVEQKKVLEEFYEEKHNLLNELIALRGGIFKKDRNTVIESLNRIIRNYDRIGNISKSGNCTVDAIINFKYATAREYGIDFRLKIFIPEEFPVEQCDMGVVLGNALDNAIEAVERCKAEQKYIEISMGVKKEAWVMVIKNPYEHEIKRNRNGQIVSDKEEAYRHGFGLESIRRIAEKYFGDFIIDVDEHIFSLTVVLNFK